MPLPDDIVSFLQTHSTESYCDDCLAEDLNVPPSEARKAASALGAQDRVDRRMGQCVQNHSIDRYVNRSLGNP